MRGAGRGDSSPEASGRSRRGHATPVEAPRSRSAQTGAETGHRWRSTLRAGRAVETSAGWRCSSWARLLGLLDAYQMSVGPEQLVGAKREVFARLLPIAIDGN